MTEYQCCLSNLTMNRTLRIVRRLFLCLYGLLCCHVPVALLRPYSRSSNSSPHERGLTVAGMSHAVKGEFAREAHDYEG